MMLAKLSTQILTARPRRPYAMEEPDRSSWTSWWEVILNLLALLALLAVGVVWSSAIG